MDVKLSILCFIFLVSSIYCSKSDCVKKSEAAPEIPGSYVPQCAEDGSYKTIQCHPSTGHCWCVDKENGSEHYGTRKGPGEGEPECSPCEQPLSNSSAGGVSCLAYFVRFYYDKTSKSCKEFVYGGCFGNANNFETKEECEKACKKK